MLDEIVLRGEAQVWKDAQTKVEWLETIEAGPDYRIRKLRYEALPGFWIPALLYEPRQLSGKVPVTLQLNGHDSNGKAAGYKQIRCINLAKRCMIALNAEFIGQGQLTQPGQGPELFCFGLLAEFDVATILSLAAAREITLRDVDRQSRDAFAPLCERLRLAGKTVEIAAGGETR